MGGFVRELLNDFWKDIKQYWWAIPIIILLVWAYTAIVSVLVPPPKPKYWQITYDDGVYTTDSISYTPVGCITIPKSVFCGSFKVVEKEGSLPNERFN
jgi:hypothetical protein